MSKKLLTYVCTSVFAAVFLTGCPIMRVHLEAIVFFDIKNEAGEKIPYDEDLVIRVEDTDTGLNIDVHRSEDETPSYSFNLGMRGYFSSINKKRINKYKDKIKNHALEVKDLKGVYKDFAAGLGNHDYKILKEDSEHGIAIEYTVILKK